jgi:signal peptidase I
MQKNAKLLISIVCIAAVFGIVSVTGVIGLTSAPDSSGSIEYVVVVSNSMEPSIYRGDIVKVENNPNDIQVGDMIIYKATWIPEEVLHRVIAIHKAENGTTYFIAKGDNNPVQDPESVYQNQIVSKVVTSNGQPVVIPKIGYISLWIRGL